jgi:hypothetical protein
VKRVLLFGLLAGMLTAGTGCGLYQAVFCYHPCGGCGPGCCGDSCNDCCGSACEPACRPVRPACAPHRAVVADCDDGCDCGCAKPCHKVGCRSCSSCGDSCCDPCADPCGDGCCRPWYRGPLSCLFALFTPNCWCGPSCGERYWGDFYSDPPDCSDPCDDGGNYTGRGCHNCGGAQHGHARGYVDDGEPVADEGVLTPQAERLTTPAPKPTPAPHRAVRSDSQ